MAFYFNRPGELPLAMLLALSWLLWACPSWAIPCLTGFVSDMNGSPVADADLDFNISATGQRVTTPGDNTDVIGFYSVCVLPNIYDVAFEPPDGTRLQGKLLRGVDLRPEAGLELDVTLEAGMVASGTVRDPDGIPVVDVDIDVDRVEGGRLYTPGDNTDAAGGFRVVVPAGTHRFKFEPPRGSRLRGAEIDSVLVDGDIILDIALESGFLFQGRVTDRTGAPVIDVDVDLREMATGAKVLLANNATDAQGDFIVAAPTGEFQLRFIPPRNSAFIARSFNDFALFGDTTRDQELESGYLVTVEITGTGDLPIEGADLDVKDAATGFKLFTPHDRTDVSGRAVAVLPGGVFDFYIDPPVGASYAGAFLSFVHVTSDTTIAIQLEGSPRVTLNGRVVDGSGAGVVGAVFGARLASTGEKIRLTNDQTLSDGSFVLDLPPLPIDLTLEPSLDSRLVGRRLEGIFVEQDTTWSPLVLEEGRLVNVSVTGTAGRPVVSADLDFTQLGTGEEIFTPGDNTDQEGRVVVVVPDGSFDILVTPPVRSGFAPKNISGVSVGTDTTMVIVLSVDASGGGGVAVQPGRPNPFNEMTAIDFLLEQPAEVTLSVYDLRGRLVRQLTTGSRAEGMHTEMWDGRTNSGARAPAGVYVAILRSAVGDSRQRLTLVH